MSLSKLFLPTMLLGDVLAEKLESKCPFGFTSSSSGQKRELAEQFKYPSEFYKHSDDTVSKTTSMSIETYEELVHDTIMLYESVDPAVTDSVNLRASFVGCLLRQAGHDFMDYRPNDPNVGGMDGCMSYDDPDNKGLLECSQKFGLDKLFENWHTRVSLADFMAIIAEAAIGRVATDNFHQAYDRNNYFRDDTFAKYLRDTFKWGRETAHTCGWNMGRMPNPEYSCEGKGPGKDGLKQIFVDNIYKDAEFPWTLTTAISGAHTIGRTNKEFSGYDGFWTDSKSAGIFNNDYYISVLAKGWAPELAVGGNPEKNQWKKTDLGNKYQEMMLTSDMCLAYRNNVRAFKCKKSVGGQGWAPNMHDCQLSFSNEGIDLDPKDSNCCAWTKWVYMNGFDNVPKEICGFPAEERHGKDSKQECCGADDDAMPDCDHKYNPTGYGQEDMMDFVRDEKLWLKQFARAWHMATENGMDLTPLNKEESDKIFKQEKDAESTICTDLNPRNCQQRENCKRSLMDVRPELLQQFYYMCSNQNKPQSNQRGELTYRKNFFKNIHFTNGYNSNMTQRSTQYRGLVQLEHPTAGTTVSKEFPPSNVLRRQDGWNTKHGPEYFETHSKPFNWGINELTEPNPGKYTMTSIWQSKGEGTEWWRAQFEDGLTTVESVKVSFQRRYDGINPPAEQEKKWQGTKVYIGQQLCGTVGKGEGEFWLTDSWMGEVRVECQQPLKGRNVMIRMENQKLAISDVQVFSVLPTPDYLKVPSLEYATQCARNGQTCTCNGTVYFGNPKNSAGNWVSKEVDGEIECKQENFPESTIKRGGVACKCFSRPHEHYIEAEENQFIVG